MATYHDHLSAAAGLRDRILSGSTNETPVRAWAAVCRECAFANEKARAALADNAAPVHPSKAFLNSLQQLWWFAKAQHEALVRRAA